MIIDILDPATFDSNSTCTTTYGKCSDADFLTPIFRSSDGMYFDTEADLAGLLAEVWFRFNRDGSPRYILSQSSANEEQRLQASRAAEAARETLIEAYGEPVLDHQTILGKRITQWVHDGFAVTFIVDEAEGSGITLELIKSVIKAS
jgi:hypothetical protein